MLATQLAKRRPKCPADYEQIWRVLSPIFSTKNLLCSQGELVEKGWMALSQNTLKKIKISTRIHLFPSKDVNTMLKSILVTTANRKPQTTSSRLPFAVNVMLKVPIISRASSSVVGAMPEVEDDRISPCLNFFHTLQMTNLQYITWKYINCLMVALGTSLFWYFLKIPNQYYQSKIDNTTVYTSETVAYLCQTPPDAFWLVLHIQAVEHCSKVISYKKWKKRRVCPKLMTKWAFIFMFIRKNGIIFVFCLHV